jgi:hypothetical protein
VRGGRKTGARRKLSRDLDSAGVLVSDRYVGYSCSWQLCVCLCVYLCRN